MATKTRARVCGDKQRHDRRSDAEEHLWSLVRGGAPLRRLRVYRCRFCGHWHVGHRPGRRRR